MSEYEIKWWKDWLEGDSLDRIKLVEKLPFTTQVLEIHKLKDEKIQKYSVALMLNGFFEDLENAIHTKQRIEKEKNERSRS